METDPGGSAATAFALRDIDGGLTGILTLSQLAAYRRSETAPGLATGAYCPRGAAGPVETAIRGRPDLMCG